MDKDTLKLIIDQVFAALEEATKGKLFLHMAVQALHVIAISLIDKMLASVTAALTADHVTVTRG